ncbi:N-acetylglutaminylglutamine amidotransferase [Quadrisphaera sp. INWT6]|uniref:N-acetylglutaminylglutamine amidotransferase n=1 Tax=Quadrisphaera sp. INWT6 TaxID=2596917 RepID=UPI0018920A0B|nr:N-acetylglutaminylglutamine amidotransferase [Quadrisphaera sp. INWT6]MBF5081582.1 N-acetylglutaminylglutamine amidotransferase [Quadrisphaera sp. INWT6]
MCGLSGELRFDSTPADAAAVRCMSEVLAPRGPDGSGEWARGPVALAHRRLAIIDLSDAGAQPMVDGEGADQLVAVFNGCIYNHHELRAELTARGHRFWSTSDTEVILKGYREWGADVVDHLVGMFAVVLHEVGSGRVVMARDRLGIKPLYVAETPGRVRFASSLPALVAAGDLDTSVDPVALHHYLSWHAVVPAPRTVLRGVRKLPPATVRVYETRSGSAAPTDRVYWQPSYERDPAKAGWSARDWEDAVEDALRTAVRRRLVADVPVGVLLSGGLDSSLIVGLLAEEGQTGLATFSIGFDAAGGREGDEFQYSDVIAAHYATDHHKIAVDAPTLVDALPHAVGAMSEPMVSHDVVAFDLLCEQVAKEIRVVQSGQGADEVFAGYHWYPPMADVPGAPGGGPDVAAATDRYARAFFDRGPDGPGGMSWLVSPGVLEGMLAEGGPDASRAFVAAHLGRPGAATAVDAALRLDTEVMLVDDPVKRVDNTSMAWGLEARVPFLDHDLVALAAQVPPELKLADGGKGVLKAIGRRTIPTEVIDRPKGYFPVPALTHLEGGVLDLVRDALTSDAARHRGLFSPAAVTALVDDPNGQLTPLKGNRLWQLGLLELWLQTHGVR